MNSRNGRVKNVHANRFYVRHFFLGSLIFIAFHICTRVRELGLLPWIRILFSLIPLSSTFYCTTHFCHSLHFFRLKDENSKELLNKIEVRDGNSASIHLCIFIIIFVVQCKIFCSHSILLFLYSHEWEMDVQCDVRFFLSGNQMREEKNRQEN